MTATCLGATLDEVAAQQATELPGIVVEAATIAVRPAKPNRKSSSPTTQASQSTSGSPASAASSIDASGPSASGDVGAGGPVDPAGNGNAGGADAYGSAASVITGDELRLRQIRNAEEALRAMPGVSVSRGGSLTGLSQVRIRGEEASHTKVFVDGIEANVGSSGEFDFTHLSAGNIERIEVLRGPQSGLYGSGASSGVINIITRSGKGPAQVTLTTEGGSFGTGRIAASLSGGNERAHGLLAFDYLGTRGFNIAPIGNENDEAKRSTFMFKGGVMLTDSVALDLVLRNVNKSGDRDNDGGPGPLAQQSDSPSQFASTALLGGAALRINSFGGRLTHKLFVNASQTRLDDTDISSFGTFFSRNDNERLKFGYATTLRLDPPLMRAARHTLTALVENEVERFNPVTDDDRWRSREHVAFVGEFKGEYWRQLHLAATLRHDAKIAVEDPRSQAGDIDGFTTWRASVAWAIPNLGLRPHASVGTGVKLPTMFEQFGFVPTLFQPNPGLQPERTFGWDAGLETTLWGGRAVVDVTYFRQRLENEIETFYDPTLGAFGLFTAANRTGFSHREGVETSVKLRLTDQVTLGGAYTFLNATEPDGSREIRRPRHSGRIDLGYVFDNGRGKLTLSGVYNGRATDYAFTLPFFDPRVLVTLDDYWLVTAAASYQIQPGVEVFGRIENLLDIDYREIYGFNTPGIAAYGGVKLTFGGERGGAAMHK